MWVFGFQFVRVGSPKLSKFSSFSIYFPPQMFGKYFSPKIGVMLPVAVPCSAYSKLIAQIDDETRGFLFFFWTSHKKDWNTALLSSIFSNGDITINSISFSWNIQNTVSLSRIIGLNLLISHIQFSENWKAQFLPTRNEIWII